MLKPNPCPEVSITNQIKEYFDGRSQLGWEKYGQTMDRTDLDPLDWLNHMIDELGDGLQYAFALRQTMTNTVASASEPVPSNESSDAMAKKLGQAGFPCYVPITAPTKEFPMGMDFENIYAEDNFFYLDEEFEMHLCAVVGFVADAEDGNLIVIQLTDGWIAISINCLYNKM